MKILYKQPKNTDKSYTFSPFSQYGITNCYFKQLHIDKDTNIITKNEHHHLGFEIHMIEQGNQTYEIGGLTYTVAAKEFLLIPPMISHKVICSARNTIKFSLTFTCITENLIVPSPNFLNCFTSGIPEQVMENIRFIISEISETKMAGFLSRRLIENRVFECLILLLRSVDLHVSTPSEHTESDSEDFRLTIVKQYISDNIEFPLTVSELAGYCYLSPKQITRIFYKHEGMSPAQYIKKQRIAYIEKLLSENELSLKAISDKMHFQNEYYFNAFVKKHLGMPPGAYKKSVKQ